jgi:hypothetical protein
MGNLRSARGVASIALIAVSLLSCSRSSNSDSDSNLAAQHEQLRQKNCPDLPTWEACEAKLRAETAAAKGSADRAAETAASAVAAQRSSALRWFLDSIAAVRIVPQKAGPKPECEDDGICHLDVFDDAGDADLGVRYARAQPSAQRFSTHFPFEVWCPMLGAKAGVVWYERPGTIYAAGGSTCDFPDGSPLAGLRVLIENNHRPNGTFNTGVYVFSPAYLDRDRSFAEGLAKDLANAKR